MLIFGGNEKNVYKSIEANFENDLKHYMSSITGKYVNQFEIWRKNVILSSPADK